MGSCSNFLSFLAEKESVVCFLGASLGSALDPKNLLVKGDKLASGKHRLIERRRHPGYDMTHPRVNWESRTYPSVACLLPLEADIAGRASGRRVIKELGLQRGCAMEKTRRVE